MSRVLMKSIRIEPETVSRAVNAWITIDVENGFPEPKKTLIAVILRIGEDSERVELTETLEPGSSEIESMIRIEDPELWWPNGFGEPAVYHCLAGMQAEDSGESAAECKLVLRSVGFERPEGGNWPVLSVNDRLIYYKAAQFPTQSALPVEKLADIARRAGLNMMICDDPSKELREACDANGLVLAKPSDLASADGSMPSALAAPAPSEPADEQTSALRCAHFLSQAILRHKAAGRVPGVVVPSLADSSNPGALLDESGKARASFYFVKRALAGVTVSLLERKSGALRASVVNDGAADFVGSLHLGILTFGPEGIVGDKVAVEVPSGSKVAPWEVFPNEAIADPAKQGLVAALFCEEKLVSKALYFEAGKNGPDYPIPRIFVQREDVSESSVKLTISADEFARCVVIEDLLDGATLTDNYFDLLPAERHEVTIENITPEESAHLGFWVSPY